MRKKRSSGAFTLVELLVACTVLTILMIALGQMASSSGNILRSTSRRADQFREAREALESIQYTLSQATLNTYYDYQRADINSPPTGYVRQSELRYMSGNAATLGLTTGSLGVVYSFATQAVFFQAPLGYVSNSTSYGSLHSLLNTCGYYVTFDTDKNLRPGFLQTVVPERYRYRLMELRQPSDTLTLYLKTSGPDGTTQLSQGNTYTGQEWFQTPIKSGTSSQVLAENIIALVVYPQLSQADQSSNNFNADALINPNYTYDSSSVGNYGTKPYLGSKNQLPPVMQITLVAIDEASAKRLNPTSTSSTDPLLTSGYFALSSQYDTDLTNLQAALTNKKVGFRVFTTKFNVLSSKWSTTQ